MSKPVPGTVYTVVPGDSIRSISRRAYGNDQSARIVEENYQLLKGRRISLEGLPTIYAGDVLQIPASTSRYGNRTVTADFDSEITIVLDGTEYRGVKASNIKRAMNTIADGFVFEIPFDPYDKTLVDALRPFSYKPAELYIGGERYITGRCLKPRFSTSGSGIVCTVEVRTRPGDMIECRSSRQSLEYYGQTLLQIANDVAGRYGLRAYSTHGDSDAFSLVAKEIDEGDFDFLARLASQKGFLITSATDGNIMFARATPDAKPVAALRLGEYPVLSATSEFDGAMRFSEWFGYAEVSGEPEASAFRRDPGIGIKRPYAFKADESEAENIETAVLWKLAQSIADGANVSVAVSGWRNLDGQLWEELMVVTFWGPGVFVMTESRFVVKSVDLSKGTDGDVTVLGLALPEAYNKTIPKNYPWSGYAEAAR